MVCLRNICINTLHKGGNDDDDNDNKNSNNNPYKTRVHSLYTHCTLTVSHSA